MKNGICFRGLNGKYYTGSHSYEETEREYLHRVCKYEKMHTIFDRLVSDRFMEYYRTFIEMGFTDVAEVGVSLDTPDRSFAYIVDSTGQVCSFIAKVEPYNWLKIYNADLMFEDLDDGRKFLEGVREFRAMGSNGGTLSRVSADMFKKYYLKNYGAFFPDARKMEMYDGSSLYDWMRDSLRGGFCFASDRALSGDFGPGYIYDRNSLYPWLFWGATMPFGRMKKSGEGFPSKYDYEAVKEGKYYLFVKVRVDISLKKGMIPFLQLEKSRPPVTSGSGEIVLTWQEVNLMYMQYNVKKIEFMEYALFNARRGVGKDFVEEYYAKKDYAKKNGDVVRSKMFKGIMNYTTGNFGKIMERVNLIYDAKNDKWRFKKTIIDEPSLIYLNMAITSAGRVATVTDAQKNVDAFLYSDTDSLHLCGPARGIFLDERKMGCYKLEHTFTEAVYKKRKWYGFKEGEEMHLVTSGVPCDIAREIEKECKGGTVQSMFDFLGC